MGITGQLREEAGPCPDRRQETTCSSFLKSGDLLTTHAQKGSLEVKTGVMPSGQIYPQASLVESILAKRYTRTHGKILRYTRYGLWTRQIKMIGPRKPRRNAPYKWFKLPRGRDSLWAHLCVYPLVLYSFLLINTLLVSLLSVFLGILFLQSRRARTLSLTPGLVAGIRRSHCRDPTLITGQELKPCFKPLQAEVTRDQSYIRKEEIWHSREIESNSLFSFNFWPNAWLLGLHLSPRLEV